MIAAAYIAVGLVVAVPVTIGLVRYDGIRRPDADDYLAWGVAFVVAVAVWPVLLLGGAVFVVGVAMHRVAWRWGR